MRKVILKMSMSLDGFVGTPGGEVEWIFRSFDDELIKYMVELLWQAGTHIMGRVTYHDMAAHWPSSTEPYAPPMNQIPKVVFSRTPFRAEWAGTTVATGDLTEEIARLKRQPGKDILAHGGAGFARALSERRLIDEYRLFVHPIVLGRGLPIFGDVMDLRLRESRTFLGGAVALTYVPA
jgi:dihydrofolate reductase